MNPDQTAPKEQSDLGTCCLPYRQPKYVSRRGSRQNVMARGKIVKTGPVVKGKLMDVT